MRAVLIPHLCCPWDAGSLRLVGPTQDWIETGCLVCERCTRQYGITQGMPRLFVDDALWQPKAHEGQGWVQLFRDTDGYQHDATDLLWPYYDEQPWLDIARQFDIALELVRPQPGQWVLDLGAGRGWAAKQFALCQCQSVAVDVFDDMQVGLGRSRAMMDDAQVVFDAVIADGERLPFHPATFDLVFCAATLHHATNLVQLLTNIGRVLRPGGHLVAIHEPCIADGTDDVALRQSPEMARELAYNIHETRPRLDEYRAALRAAGLHEQAILPWLTYTMPLHAMSSWSAELQILGPAGLPLPWTLKAATNLQRFGLARTSPDDMVRHRWAEYLLRERSGAIIVVATKQPGFWQRRRFQTHAEDRRLRW